LTVPANNCAVIVMVPATVPVCTPTFVAPAVSPAGITICAVRPPVENWIEGSSAGHRNKCQGQVAVTVAG